MRFLGGALLALTSFVSFVACSSDPETPRGAPDAGAPGDGAAPSAAECATETTALGCVACCGPTESYFQSQDTFDACMCAGPCKAECETNACAAAPTDPTPACEACLTDIPKGQTCFPEAKAVCDRDPACGAYSTCLETAKCAEKE